MCAKVTKLKINKEKSCGTYIRNITYISSFFGKLNCLKIYGYVV